MFGGFGADTKLAGLAEAIQQWIVNPTKNNLSGEGDLLPEIDEVNNVSLDLDDILVSLVDLSDKTDARSPSQAALNRAKEIVATSGQLSPDNINGQSIPSNLDPIKLALFTKIVDIWVTFEPQTQTSQITKSPEQTENQAAQERLAQTLAAFDEKLRSQKGI